jgi:hypothetical protein
MGSRIEHFYTGKEQNLQKENQYFVNNDKPKA